MNKVIPFVKRFKELCPRLEGYSTALSSRYDGWGGLYDNHGQHTILLLRYD
nr:MAG TPA: Regulator of ribonuclease activity B [Caudoviricetes sp.]